MNPFNIQYWKLSVSRLLWVVISLLHSLNPGTRTRSSVSKIWNIPPVTRVHQIIGISDDRDETSLINSFMYFDVDVKTIMLSK